VKRGCTRGDTQATSVWLSSVNDTTSEAVASPHPACTGRISYVRLLGFRAYPAMILLHSFDEHVRAAACALHDAPPGL